MITVDSYFSERWILKGLSQIDIIGFNSIMVLIRANLSTLRGIHSCNSTNDGSGQLQNQ